jgi:hypothetical protein
MGLTATLSSQNFSARYAAFSRPASLQASATAPPPTGPALAPSTDPTTQTDDDSAALIAKLDRALAALKGKDAPDAVGYDRSGLPPQSKGRGLALGRQGPPPGFERRQGQPPGGSEVSSVSASLRQTTLEIGQNGLSFTEANISFGRIETGEGSLTVASLSVTKAYLSFANTPAASTSTGTNTGASTSTDTGASLSL